MRIIRGSGFIFAAAGASRPLKRTRRHISKSSNPWVRASRASRESRPSHIVPSGRATDTSTPSANASAFLSAFSCAASSYIYRFLSSGLTIAYSSLQLKRGAFQIEETIDLVNRHLLSLNLILLVLLKLALSYLLFRLSLRLRLSQ